MPLRIGCVTQHVYPTPQEIRITRFAAAMASAGNQTVVFCPRGEKMIDDVFTYGAVRRFGMTGALRVITAPMPFSPFWENWLTRVFAQERLDLVMVRDLRLAMPAIRAAGKIGIPAVLDIGEHYPGLIEMLGKQKFAHHLTRSVPLVAWLERMAVQTADEVWVVVEENRDRLAPFAKSIKMIGNYPFFESEAPGRKAGRPFTFVSLGIIDNLRGLDLAIDAFACITPELPDARILIYGDGPILPELQRRVNSLGLGDRVLFGGWIAEADKYEALAEGDVGLLLHRPGVLTQHTMPNKLFDYMHCGLPVLATRLAPIQRILDAEECGLVVNYDTGEVAAAMLQLACAPDEGLCAMGEKGRVAVRLRYNWHTEARKVIERVSCLTELSAETRRENA